MNTRLVAAAFAVALTLPAAAMACSACGCNLDTDEADVRSGWSVDERVDYVNQSRLIEGSRGVSPALADPTNGQEVQHGTTTIWYTTTIDYNSDGAWGINLAVPFQDRLHSTYNTGDFSESKSAWNRLGDIRALGRYGLTEDKRFNLLAGFKLPTGVTNLSFHSGESVGMPVDRGLEPGSGTVDLLLGLNQSGSLTDSLGWFAQELWQKPLQQYQGFAEGQKINASLGLRYTIDPMFTAQFQLNGQNRWRDRGINADIANSGGEVIYASPGLFVTIREDTSIYSFVQLPVYQRVGGLELVPDYSASVGIRYKF